MTVFKSLFYNYKNKNNQKKEGQTTTVAPIFNEVPILNPNLNREDSQYEKLCCICALKKYDNIFLPCGHVCCCGICAKKVFDINHQCPICRKRIDKYQKIIEA